MHPLPRPNTLLGSALLVSCGLLALAGCNDEGNGNGGRAQTYTLSASISGLSSDGLTLAVNGTAKPVAQAESTLELASNLSPGTQYAVTVATQPAGQSCSVAGGSGTITSANVANVVVTCASLAFDLGGTIIGLNGDGLVLANGADTLSVSAGATTFTMPTKVAYSSSYAVSVKTQPAGITCAVVQGTGTMPANASRNVVLTCSDQPFTIGGSISGLGANSGLVLSNGTDTLTVAASAATFSMPASVPFGSQYAVSVQSSPPGLNCSAANGSGTVGAADVTDISITCSDRSFAVGGTISGLSASGLVLANGSDTLSVPSNASSFTMTQPISYTGTYAISVQTNPTGETCTVSGGSGVMGTDAINSVAVTCSPTIRTVGGTISGLGANTGLVLLNNGGDATPISANAATFTMQTGVASGSAYSISVGTQPYGIALSCGVTAGSGNANANVTTVAVTCSPASLTATPVVDYFSVPLAVAVDAYGNVFVADNTARYISEIPFNNGSYSSKVTRLLSGVQAWGVRLDGTGNLFVSDVLTGSVLKLPYINGSYNATASQVVGGLNYPVEIGIGPGGNLFVSNTGSVVEVINTNGSYGTPFQVGSGFTYPNGVAVDASGNVFVAENTHSHIDELINSNGSYAATAVAVGSGLNVPNGLAMDSSGNLFVADKVTNVVRKIPFSAGTFGAPMVIAATLSLPWDINVDSSGNVFVDDRGSRVIKKIPFDNGNYAQPAVVIGSGVNGPLGAAVDSHGNVFIADSANSQVKMFSYNNGNYGAAPVLIGSGFNNPTAVALDASGNLFVTDTNNNAVEEFVLTSGSYSTTAVVLGSGFNRPQGVAVDSGGNLLVGDTNNNQVKKIAFSNGTYSATPTTVASITSPATVAVDSRGNVFTVQSPIMGAQNLEMIAFNNGSYSAPVTLGPNLNPTPSIAVDAIGNVFLADQSSSSVKELVYSNGTYASSPVVVRSGFSSMKFLALDVHGRVYAGDQLNVQVLAP